MQYRQRLGRHRVPQVDLAGRGPRSHHVAARADGEGGDGRGAADVDARCGARGLDIPQAHCSVVTARKQQRAVGMPAHLRGGGGGEREGRKKKEM